LVFFLGNDLIFAYSTFVSCAYVIYNLAKHLITGQLGGSLLTEKPTRRQRTKLIWPMTLFSTQHY